MAYEHASDRAEKVEWLLANQSLWGCPTDCAIEMMKAKLYRSNTYLGDVKRSLWKLIELARQVQNGELALESLRSPRGAKPASPKPANWPPKPQSPPPPGPRPRLRPRLRP